MYLIINGNKHTVSRRIVQNNLIKYLTVTPEPSEVSGIIQMFDNSGFLISEDNSDKFLRHTYSGTLLTLTNVPEPVVVETEPIELTPEELREQAYNTEEIIEWKGRLITVTEASQQWQYYASEGSSNADDLRALISAAKATIREKHPDGRS